MNRRSILKLLAAAPIGAALPGCGTTSASTLASSTTDTLAHGLLFGPERIPELRELYLRNPLFESVRAEAEAIDRADTRQFIASGLRLNDQFRDLRRLGETAETMALHFLLAEDADAGELAAECVRAMLRFPKWDYFLDGDDVVGVQRAPAATIAIALASDWLGSTIPNDERREWLTVMGERGCMACYRSLYDIMNPQQVTGWRFDPESTLTILRPGNYTDLNRRPEITETTNLRAIPACGLVMGAVALADLQLDDTQATEWLEMGVETIRDFGDIYRPDGSYHEGLGYANYTSEHLMQATTVLQRKRQLDLRGEINWTGYVDYVLNLSMATAADPADIVNFGDNGNPKTGERGRVKRTAVPFWIARNMGSGRAQWVANHLTGGTNLHSLLFYDPSAAELAPPSGPVLWESDLDWIVARTGYTADDLVVAMRSGGPANHEHADRNSLIVKCFGQQLVTDPYRPPYSFADPAWSMRLTQGHSAILIDGQGHEHHNGVEGTNASQSYARIVSSAQHADHAIWTSDASQPYRLVDLKIASVVRTVVVFYELPAVVVVDRVVKRENASTVQARFFGFNWDGQIRHELSASSFTVHRPGAVLHGSAYCSHGLDVRLGRLDVVEERAERHPFVEVSTPPAMDTVLVTALGIGRDAASALKAQFTEDAGQVTARLGSRRVVVDRAGKVSVM
ncbi:MAG: hypothetical protein Rubg2KO_38000 [Rubricoccaceae bacterium]